MGEKILIIVENMPVPPDFRVWKEARSLRQAGYDVIVLCPRGKGGEKGYEFIEGVHIYRHPTAREGHGAWGYVCEYAYALFWEFLYSWWIYLRRGFHVIQGCNPPDDIFLVALPFKLLGVKYIFDHHDVNPELYLAKYGKTDLFYKIQLWLERMTFRCSDVVMSTNNSYREIAITRGGIPEDDVFVVRNGPSPATFKAVSPNPARKYGKRYLVGYVGVMNSQEGLDILLEVALRIKNLGRKDIHFTCVGRGPELATLRKMTQDKQLDDMVNFTGFVPDAEMVEILSTADVCVNPDRPSSMNSMSTMIKILEYMGLGKPIVQFEGTEGRFSAQDASLYSNASDPVVDFSDKILWLLDHPEVRQRMGQYGRTRIEKELAWEYSVQSLLAAYEKAFSKMRRKHPFQANIPNPEMYGVIRQMNKSLCQYYQCPERRIPLFLKGSLSGEDGYFKFGHNVLYGRLNGAKTATTPSHAIRDVSSECVEQAGAVYLPFDATQVANNLRHEAYTSSSAGWHPGSSLLGRGYYFLRPALPVGLRKHLQKFRLNGWRQLGFPHWPVDRTVDTLLEDLLLLSLRAGQQQEIPFIWFWPNGATSCAIMTHDVETSVGRDFCSSLMDIDGRFGIKASFQVVPESRYDVPESYLESIRSRGFEVNVQDLNHDGRLFRSKKEFLARVVKINEYRRQFKAEGFRSAVLYRRQEWFDALDFSYDMSVPNVAHLDPQRGGCCTVMPYFVGNLVELPVTMTQDYSLFHILEEHSIELWKQQIELIIAKHGLINLIIHPDYIIDREERATYETLLAYLTRLRAEKNVWMPLPGEVASWWRERSNMRLVEVDGAWQIEGTGRERAQIAYASEKDGQLVYSFESSSEKSGCSTLASQRDLTSSDRIEPV